MSKIEGIIEGALNKVPGYKGYRDKENRRDADKQIRETLAAALSTQIDALNAYNAELSRQRDFESLAALEPAIGQVRLLADRIRTASYGYGGIFTDDGVDANALEQLRLFDAALLREADGLALHVKDITSKTPPDGEARTALLEEINRLSALFDSRNGVVSSGKITEDEAALQILSLPEVLPPSPLLSLKRGDALSVLGDNYIANGIMMLRNNQGKILMARVSTESEGATWLLGSSIPGIRSARLTEHQSAAGGYQTMEGVTADIDTQQGEEKDIAARYSYRVSDDSNVALTLAVGDSLREFSGEFIMDEDIEVYGLA